MSEKQKYPNSKFPSKLVVPSSQDRVGDPGPMTLGGELPKSANGVSFRLEREQVKVEVTAQCILSGMGSVGSLVKNRTI